VVGPAPLLGSHVGQEKGSLLSPAANAEGIDWVIGPTGRGRCCEQSGLARWSERHHQIGRAGVVIEPQRRPLEEVIHTGGVHGLGAIVDDDGRKADGNLILARVGHAIAIGVVRERIGRFGGGRLAYRPEWPADRWAGAPRRESHQRAARGDDGKADNGAGAGQSADTVPTARYLRRVSR
jgi:hypothetical protein